jgi:hypothetical protein
MSLVELVPLNEYRRFERVSNSPPPPDGFSLAVVAEAEDP